MTVIVLKNVINTYKIKIMFKLNVSYLYKIFFKSIHNSFITLNIDLSRISKDLYNHLYDFQNWFELWKIKVKTNTSVYITFTHCPVICLFKN
jgi:hypothetical protein